MSNLDLMFRCDDLGRVVSIREYLAELLLTLWRQGESFSGKRPFCNSGWDWDLFVPLIKAGVVRGTLDEFGYIAECDDERGHALVAEMIREMCGTGGA